MNASYGDLGHVCSTPRPQVSAGLVEPARCWPHTLSRLAGLSSLTGSRWELDKAGDRHRGSPRDGVAKINNQFYRLVVSLALGRAHG